MHSNVNAPALSLTELLQHADWIDSIRQYGTTHLGLATVDFVAPEQVAPYAHSYQQWLKAGYHGTMSYLERNEALRFDPTQLLPHTQTVIVVRLNYWDHQLSTPENILKNPEQVYVSRYALGRDYHKVLRQKLKALQLFIEKKCQQQQINTPVMGRPFVDSAPVLERQLALEAGSGFIGKNTLLIHPRAGSFFFLGELFCSLSLREETPIQSCGCGPCNACIDHCPTQAFVSPGVLDARKCISYLTIEYDGIIDDTLAQKMGNRIYGCDDCQLVCPWNKFTPQHQTDDFHPRHQLHQASLTQLWQWTEQDFLDKLQGSPIRRIGYHQWQRNLTIALGNSGNPDHIPLLQQTLQTTTHDVLKHHLQQAIDQLQHPPKSIETIPIQIHNKRKTGKYFV